MGRSRIVLCVVIFSLAAILSPSNGSDETQGSIFYDSTESEYLKEYRTCTGDMRRISRTELFAFKSRLTSLAQSAEYQSLLAEYMKKTNSTAIPVPCTVLFWNSERKKRQTETEDTLILKQLAIEELETAREEALSCSTYSYGIVGLPFGLSKKTFSLLYKNAFGMELIDMGSYMYVNHFVWDTLTCLTAFYFDRKSGKFYRYEIEMPPQPADLLNTTVRPQARALAGILAQQFGTASHANRVGFFEIKSGTLSPCEIWNAPNGWFVAVGLAMNKYKYYAKAIVSAPPAVLIKQIPPKDSTALEQPQ